MNARATTSLPASIVLSIGLLAAPAVAVPAAATPPAVAVAAKTKHKIPDRCWPSYKYDLQLLHRRMDVQLPHYDSHYESVNGLLDDMVDALSSGAEEVLPYMEDGAAKYRETMSPIIADDRATVNKILDLVQRSNKGCFKGNRQDKFLAAMKLVRSSYRDLFRAYEKVQMAAYYLTTAQTAKAQEALNNAQVEAATVEAMFDSGMRQLRALW